MSELAEALKEKGYINLKIISGKRVAVISDDNRKDLADIPKNILKEIEIVSVKDVDEVLKIALTKELKPVEWIEVESLPKTKDGQKPVAGSTH